MRFPQLFVNASLLTAVTLSSSLFAQSDTGSISGFVKDASTAGVPAATVVVTSESSGLERHTTTNETGHYVVSVLPSGYYTVTVEASGFKRFVKSRNKLDPNVATTVDVDLSVGAVTESVEVVAAVAQVQSETATVGKLIESSLLDNIQLNGRNPIYLALLKPGVRGGSLQTFNFAQTNGGLAINGSRTEHNLITIDGTVATRTRANDSQVGVSNMDTVQEIQVLTTNYNAEYGRTDGGQIRIVTKSGGRHFHGSAYEYFRNSALNANTWVRNATIGQASISSSPEAFRFNQFGYVFDGPVYIPKRWNTGRNRLFFLWSQEWTRYRQTATATGTVPSDAMRQGDFSELLNPANRFFGRARTIKDPNGPTLFPNNVIPRGMLSPNGLALLNAFPSSSPGFQQGTANYIAVRPQQQNQRLDTISVDFNPAQNHFFRFRNQRYGFDEVTAFRTNTDRAPQSRTRPNQTYSLSYTWTISPTLVNEVILTTAVERNYIFVDTRSGNHRRSKYGINYPYLFPNDKEIFDKIPTIDISGFVSVDGGPYPSSSTGPVYVASDNITKIHGNHTFKAGFSFERGGENDFDQINVQGVPGGTNNQNGRFIFDDTRGGAPSTTLAVANTAMGLFSTYAEIGSRSYTPYRSHLIEWFVQDGWKATSRLKIELGIRHSIFQPYYSLWRNMVMFDARYYDAGAAVTQDRATGYVLSGDRYNGLVIPGSGWPDSAKGRVPLASDRSFDRLFHDTPKGYSQTHYRDFQPRVGLAYQITPKTVFRSGVGEFFNRQIVGGSVFPGGNPPLQPMVSIANAEVDNPSGGKQSFFPLNITTRDPVFKNPAAWAWNATFERALGFDSIIEVAYVGRRGYWLERERNINQLAPGTIQANPGVNPDVLRPYKGLGPLRMGENAANSRYNGLQIGLTRRFTKGLGLGVAYTYSKSDDNASGYRDLLPNNFDDRNFWGPSTFDTRHVMVINFVYALPIFKDRSRLSGKFLGGWQLSGVSQFQTGTPVSVTTSDDFAGVGPGSGLQYWSLNGDPFLPRGDRKFSQAPGDGNLWFRTKNADGTFIFTAPAAGRFGNGTRNPVYNPGLQNWNAALFKDFTIRESQRVQFRFESYNWNNHPNWNTVTVDPRSATFGAVTSKTSERQLQLSLRYSF